MKPFIIIPLLLVLFNNCICQDNCSSFSLPDVHFKKKSVLLNAGQEQR
jgi:hypothetical protein